jgi:hypothetical protein
VTPLPSCWGHISHKAFAARLSRALQFEVKTAKQPSKTAASQAARARTILDVQNCFKLYASRRPLRHKSFCMLSRDSAACAILNNSAPLRLRSGVGKFKTTG